MKLLLWVTAAAALSLTCAKNSTSKAKPKRQLNDIRTPQNLQYTLVLPHSRVAHYRALTSGRRISNIAPTPRGQLPPYAVQMEPVVQYSQKDPLYDPNLENIDDNVNQNELQAQPKILNVHGNGGFIDLGQSSEFGPPYGAFPTAPLYGHEQQPHYYEAPEPIIEIIIKESNESLPAPLLPPIVKKKKEPVQVFYVKYSKDPYSKDKVVYEKPIPAITPPTNDEDDHQEDYVTVTPEPYYASPVQTTTLRAIIKPESEQYHSDSSVKVTFGSEHHGHHSDRREGVINTEDREETAPQPAIAYPHQQPKQQNLPLERPKSHFRESAPRPLANHQVAPTYRPVQQHAQSRIQFQSPFLTNEQQLPRQAPSVAPFRGQSHIARQNPFAPSPSGSPINFGNGFPGPNNNHFTNSPTAVPGPLGPIFTTAPTRSHPSFHQRPNSPPTFAPRPHHFNSPPRSSFHSGPQRPFHSAPQPQSFFDEPKYLQENYHTITTEQVDPPKDQLLPSRQPNFNFIPRPSPIPVPSINPGPGPSSGPFQEHHNHHQHIPTNQQLPQQRPPQQFADTHNKPVFSANPTRSPFYNLKPSPPHVEQNAASSFQQHQSPQQHFSFHNGPTPLSRPSIQIPSQPILNNHNHFQGPSPSPSPQPSLSHFLPQPSPSPQFNFHQQQPSPTPDRPINFHQQNTISERPVQFSQPHNPSERPQQFIQLHNPSDRPQHFSQPHNPSERPQHFSQPHNPSERPSINPQQSNFQEHLNHAQHHNLEQFVPNGGELVAAIPKYEQHITIGPTGQPQSDYNGLNKPTPTAAIAEQQYRQQFQQQFHDSEQEQVRLQLAQNVQKQQEEIQKLQNQLLIAQQHQHQQQNQQQQQQQQQNQQEQQQKQQHTQQQQEQHQQQQQQQQYQQQQQQQHQQQHQQLLQKQTRQYEQNYKQLQNGNSHTSFATSPKPQYNIQERARPQPTIYPSSTASPPYYQSTSRTVEIKPTTQKYVSSTINSISTTPEAKKQEKKKRPTIQLPDEVPDDLREQLLSSGILDNADISILDYDKVGDTPLDSLPPDQLANFFSAGGGQQIAASENRPIIVKPNGDRIEARIDNDEEDQEISASENIPNYIIAPPMKKEKVEMKVVHFDPETVEGQNIAKDYVKEDATRLEPVALNDKKYNRYLPLKVSGNQFPLPDILKGKKVTSVVVLAPVETEAINNKHSRSERATTNTLKGIKFIAGDSLHDLLRRPTKENFEKWLEIEKKTSSDQQSVILLVTGKDETTPDREIYMYDIGSGKVNKLNGELSNAFVDAAENNSLSKDIEKLAIEGDGTPETFNKKTEDDSISDGSENVPLFVDLSGLSLDQESSNQVSISSGYSKTKLGRSLRRH